VLAVARCATRIGSRHTSVRAASMAVAQGRTAEDGPERECATSPPPPGTRAAVPQVRPLTRRRTMRWRMARIRTKWVIPPRRTTSACAEFLALYF
jgi:hypothetical protein